MDFKIDVADIFRRVNVEVHKALAEQNIKNEYNSPALSQASDTLTDFLLEAQNVGLIESFQSKERKPLGKEYLKTEAFVVKGAKFSERYADVAKPPHADFVFNLSCADEKYVQIDPEVIGTKARAAVKGFNTSIVNYEYRKDAKLRPLTFSTMSSDNSVHENFDMLAKILTYTATIFELQAERKRKADAGKNGQSDERKSDDKPMGMDGPTPAPPVRPTPRHVAPTP